MPFFGGTRGLGLAADGTDEAVEEEGRVEVEAEGAGAE